MANIFAWRETDPALLRKATAPIGPLNDQVLIEACDWADQIICGWGTHGEHLGRGSEVEALLRLTGVDLHCLGLTQAGHPRHPLYIAYRQHPEIWPQNNAQP